MYLLLLISWITTFDWLFKFFDPLGIKSSLYVSEGLGLGVKIQQKVKVLRQKSEGLSAHGQRLEILELSLLILSIYRLAIYLHYPSYIYLPVFYLPIYYLSSIYPSIIYIHFLLSIHPPITHYLSIHLSIIYLLIYLSLFLAGRSYGSGKGILCRWVHAQSL